jgi:hypothetical protein
MVFEEIVGLVQLLLILGAFLFIPLYLLDIIRDRLRQKSKLKDMLVLYFVSCLIALAVFPLALTSDFYYTLDYYAFSYPAVTSTPVVGESLVYYTEDLPFQDPLTTYALVLLFLFLVYLIVFNKTKE